MLDAFQRELRLAWRSLRARPAFGLAVVVAVAMGIGTTTAVVSVVDAVLLRPLPFAEPQRLVRVWENDRISGTAREAASGPDFFDLQRDAESFVGLAAFATTSATSSTGGEPERVSVASVSHDLADLLGVPPLLGRTFRLAEDVPGGPRAALLSHSFWTRRFGGDPAAVGETLELDDEPYQIVGVLPAATAFPSPETDVWVTLQENATSAPRHRHWVNVVGRLRADRSLAATQAELASIAARLEAEHPENRGRGLSAEPLAEVLRGRARPPLLLLLGAVVAVLLVVCANVSGLLAARGAERRREVAIRVALGSGRGALVGGLLVESLFLTLFAAALGVALALPAVRGLSRLAPAEVAALLRPEVDGRLLLFSIGLTLLVSVGLTLVPARQTLAVDLARSLRDGGERGASSRRPWGRRLLVVAQVGIAQALVLGAVLLLASLARLQRVDPGFRSDHLLRASFQLPVSRYPRDFQVWPRWHEVLGFNDRLLEGLRSLPEVRAAALSTNHPLDPGFTNSFVIVGREDEAADQPELRTRLVSEAYFFTAGVEPLAGRAFSPDDATESPPVLILNRQAAKRFFGGSAAALGEHLRFWGVDREIVGIVGDERLDGLAAAPPPAMYAPLSQAPPVGATTLLVRSSGDPAELAPAVRTAISSLDRELAVFDVTTMQQTVDGSLARERFTSQLLALFAGIALLLAALGVYGLLSQLVAQQRREMGIRLALGATRREVVLLVLRRGLGPAAVGILLGMVGTFFASRLLSALVFEISPLDPMVHLAVAAVLALVATAACVVPARRASGVPPAAALQS